MKPMLSIPLGILLTASAAADDLDFQSVPVPTADSQKRALIGSAQVTIRADIGFHTLLRSGDVLPLLDGEGDWAYGTLVDQNGDPIQKGGKNWISNSSDFNSLVVGGDGNLYLVSHFEDRPGTMYQTGLDQAADGTLTPMATRPIDFSGVKGGWVHCAGSVTPWGTHLGSEEYEPDALQWEEGQEVSEYNAQMSLYFGGDGSPASAKATTNPYRYGFPVEIEIPENGIATPTKHYAMGRMALELAYVMPDGKTVYLTDDGTNVGLFMFVADVPGDLSAGTLYAARWHQIEDEPKGGRAYLSWIDLGHATAAEVEAAIDTGVSFSRIFKREEPEDGGCPTLTSINSGHKKPFHECLALTGDVSSAVASRLETRRYAALMGATTEWRKMEGATYDPDRKALYVAMSEINKGMLPAGEDPERHQGGNDQIALPRNDCGAVYSLAVGKGTDTEGKPIASEFVARTMSGLIAGRPIDGDPHNSCALDGIANPDNISYLPGYHALVIGEDSGSGHQNDVVWQLNLENGNLNRILTTPYGSETTSVYWYKDLGGFGYLMAVVQHPYGESDAGKLILDSGDDRSYVGYFKFPAFR